MCKKKKNLFSPQILPSHKLLKILQFELPCILSPHQSSTQSLSSSYTAITRSREKCSLILLVVVKGVDVGSKVAGQLSSPLSSVPFISHIRHNRHWRWQKTVTRARRRSHTHTHIHTYTHTHFFLIEKIRG